MDTPAITLKQRLNSGNSLFGTFLSIGSTATAEVACQAGADWLFLDLEHGLPVDDLRATLMVGERYGVPIAVRPESLERIRAGRILDTGATSIVFPRIETVDEAQTALSGLAYPPEGIRGVASYNPSRQYGFPTSSTDEINASICGIVQIETLMALDNVDEIAALPGTDALFIGPGDLTAALGVPGQVDHDLYRAALDRVLAAAERHGCAAGILAMDADQAKQYANEGFRLIGIGSDALLLGRVLRSTFTSVNSVSDR